MKGHAIRLVLWSIILIGVFAGCSDDPGKSAESLPSTSAPTPEAAVKLALDVTTEIEGYWADGTANVQLALSLRNQGTIPLSDSQAVKVYCVHESNSSCGFEEVSFTLANGFGPESKRVTMRLPMGDASSLLFDYGGESVLTLDVNVPARILGVDRAVWECYSDRTLSNEEHGLGCSGWGESTNVVKWRGDAPVKMRAVGDDRYLELLDKVIAYVFPILNLKFEMVDKEEDADFKAYVGIPRSEAGDYGLEVTKGALRYPGFAVKDIRKGEALSNYIVVWLLEDQDWNKRTQDIVEGVTLHEMLHVMGKVSHTDRPTSVLQGSVLKWLSSMDEGVFRLNAHVLAEPGMTMDEVRSLIVFQDEILDEPQVSDPSTMEIVWQASAGLMNAGSARFKIRGGWTGPRCNDVFGVGGERAVLEVVFGSFGRNARIAHFQDGTTNIYIMQPRESRERQHWVLGEDGWTRVTADELQGATHWWGWSGRLNQTLRVSSTTLPQTTLRLLTAQTGTSRWRRLSMNPIRRPMGTWKRTN